MAVDDTYRLRHRPDGAALRAARAAGRLGLSQRMIPVLVRAGCLDQAGAAEGHTVRGVTAASVQEFPRRYVLASVVARSWGPALVPSRRGSPAPGLSPWSRRTARGDLRRLVGGGGGARPRGARHTAGPHWNSVPPKFPRTLRQTANECRRAPCQGLILAQRRVASSSVRPLGRRKDSGIGHCACASSTVCLRRFGSLNRRSFL